MALRGFDHESASSVSQAVKMAATHAGRAAYVAGGTDLLGALKDGVRPDFPSLLIDLKPIGSLRGIREDRLGLRIGALTTLDELSRDPTVRERYPLLAEAAHSVASPQIRNMATVGGNLCQEPRCWYYRTPENLFGCLRKGGEKCNAVLGENRHHSIFGAMRAGDPGCVANCPAHAAIPVYLEHIRTGRLDEAARLLLEANPMPAITGRVCPHFCEQACNRTQLDEPVSSRSIERFLGDRILDGAAAFYRPPKRTTGKRVAVVGSGPAGLAAAHSLRLAGHEVTVFDDHPEAGGMLRWCIPAYRLGAEVLARQIEAFERMGVRFELGANVGRQGRSLQSLRRDFHAVFLATGTWRDRKLGIEDEDLLTPALPFLIDIRRGRQPWVGKNVLVIGGGSVAVDVAVSARRLGAGKVTMACLEARDVMPAFPEDLELALEEDVALLPSWGPHRVLTDDGRLEGMELVRCTSVFDAEGRFRPSLDSSTRTTVAADQVLVAIGQAADVSYAGSSLRTDRGLLAADEETQATPLRRVYAGGDAVTGVGTVIQAIAAGRRAAAAIDQALAPGSLKRGSHRTAAAAVPSTVEINTAALERSARAVPATLAPSERGIRREDAATLDLHAVQNEAGRCVNCGCVAVNASDLGPALLALEAKIRTDRRTIPVEEFFSARLLGTTVLEAGEVLTEVVLPARPAGSVQRYLKFRVRNAIDFPIAGVACVLSHEDGRVSRARLALGAVAPVPMRAHEVETFLTGKRMDEQTAEAAAALAVRGAVPLPNNRHKVQILRTLVKRAILG
jgi:NADPH-dependent glutamate synthase beta subunit-like oxidoreductase/CO/xanthine dehydrogenase FAD-binding subunit